MRRHIVSVATTERFQRGQSRLFASEFVRGTPGSGFLAEPPGCPPHSEVPFAFKAYALRECAAKADVLLWCDSCILPIRSLDPLWERIEQQGYWFSRNGWSNYEWTADSAYPDLLPYSVYGDPLLINRQIPHVVATAFGINLKHEKGAAFFSEFFRLASETKAFCGPNHNSAHYTDEPIDRRNCGCYECGPADVLGHRYDQTAASVIAWRLGFQLTDPPAWFAYKGGETEQTILMAEGSYQ